MKHSFQPFELEQLEFDPFQKIGKDGMLITAGNEEKANAMTASWGSIGVLWRKNVASIYVRESRYTKEFLDREDYFSLAFLGKHGKAILKYFGTVSGRVEDKFREAKMELDYVDGVPYPDDAELVMICRKLSATPIPPEDFLEDSIIDHYQNGDYHTMYVGEIVKVMAR